MCGMQSNTSLPFVADEGLPAVIRLAVDALKVCSQILLHKRDSLTTYCYFLVDTCTSSACA